MSTLQEDYNAILQVNLGFWAYKRVCAVNLMWVKIISRDLKTHLFQSFFNNKLCTMGTEL